MASDLSEILKVVSVAIQEQARNLDRLLQLAETLAKQPKATPDAAEDEDDRIIAVWAKYPQGTRLTKEQVCDALGADRSNGSIGAALSRLKKAGRLGNDYPKVPGYFIAEDVGHG